MSCCQSTATTWMSISYWWHSIWSVELVVFSLAHTPLQHVSSHMFSHVVFSHSSYITFLLNQLELSLALLHQHLSLILSHLPNCLFIFPESCVVCHQLISLEPNIKVQAFKVEIESSQSPSQYEMSLDYLLEWEYQLSLHILIDLVRFQ